MAEQNILPTCFESNSLQTLYKVLNFLANSLALQKPSATNMISQISSVSGTTMAQGLKQNTNSARNEFHY